MSVFLPLLISAILLFSLLSMGAISGAWSERSGIINIAINGGFIVGAFAYSSVNSNPDFVNVVGPFSTYIGMFLAMLAGGLFAILLAIPIINFKADHVVVGTGLNILAGGLTLFIVEFLFKKESLNNIAEQSMIIHSLKDGSSTLTGHHIIIGIITLIIAGISWFAFNKTSFGLRIKTAGENPKSLEETGVSVKKIRYQAIIISGMIAGIAGVPAVMYTANRFTGNVLGLGFVALAIMIMGKRKMFSIILFAIPFSLLMAGIPRIPTNSTPGLNNWLGMIPFIFPIVVLALAKVFKYEIRDPDSLGQPYEKGQR